MFCSRHHHPVPPLPITDSRERGEEKMKKEKKYDNKYWEMEKGETIEFGSCYFMRCYDKAGKLQFGTKFKNKNTGEDVFQVKFVLDREALFSSEEAPSYLRGTVDEWEEMIEGQNNDD
ncbi:hypothetical protein ERICI_03016 [Paenibacillus larvae subsp. larvae]|uniref:Uncharacterized protein n=7 Tax=root TaxID=1 RepID=A0A0K2CZM1_9CAUD|nr:hypothetical protein VEGAS_74 [Paenibacillus phage Vegas]ALA12801.1 hypothetical protein HAYLEY_72 [Paenibacillus phage Hayley]ALA12888.1 hypothetical protein VADIM_74 [Paenibacillus phage Vadim]ALA12974.1 hypothetical protein DIANE_74 [Paenibacillus phage Diane]AVF21217.1 hypothetical protein ERICI_01323 [Paenibacillus larvae subsp. larvae]ETK26517.1 hypothetical protein ERIC1_2c07390 [Paenibacillus larvae subsp. larvae DSM 25719]